MSIKQNPHELKTEITLKITQQIGDVVLEIEAVKGRDTVEFYMHDADGTRASSLADFDRDDLVKASQFFLKASNEVRDLNRVHD